MKADKPSIIEDGNITLIEAIKELIHQNKKIGVLIIDEDWRSWRDPNPDDSHVDIQQEKLIEFSVNHKLPIWFIDDGIGTRKNLRDKTTGVEACSVTTIQKGDANGFGDGYGPIPRYADTGLHANLQSKKITHLIVMGFHVNCCVQITVGARYNDDYGKGALQYGYQVLTSGDILRSSASSPAGIERCRWKDWEGVTYFDSLGPVVTRELVESTESTYQKNSQLAATFTKFFSDAFDRRGEKEKLLKHSENDGSLVSEKCNFCNII